MCQCVLVHVSHGCFQCPQWLMQSCNTLTLRPGLGRDGMVVRGLLWGDQWVGRGCFLLCSGWLHFEKSVCLVTSGRLLLGVDIMSGFSYNDSFSPHWMQAWSITLCVVDSITHAHSTQLLEHLAVNPHLQKSQWQAVLTLNVSVNFTKREVQCVLWLRPTFGLAQTHREGNLSCF